MTPEVWHYVKPLAETALRRNVDPRKVQQLGTVVNEAIDWLKSVTWDPVYDFGRNTSAIAIQQVLDPSYTDYKKQLPAPPAIAPPAAPQTIEELKGAWTPDQSAAGSVTNTQARNLDFFNALGLQLQTAGQTGDTATWVWIAAAAGIAALAFILGRKK